MIQSNWREKMPQKKLVFKNSDKSIVSIGYEDTSRFKTSEYTIVDVPEDMELPDEISVCVWNGEKPVVDNSKKVAQEKEQKIRAEMHELLRKMAIESLNKKGEII